MIYNPFPCRPCRLLHRVRFRPLCVHLQMKFKNKLQSKLRSKFQSTLAPPCWRGWLPFARCPTSSMRARLGIVFSTRIWPEGPYATERVEACVCLIQLVVCAHLLARTRLERTMVPVLFGMLAAVRCPRPAYPSHGYPPLFFFITLGWHIESCDASCL